MLQDGAKIPLVWDGTRWSEVDYRRFRSVGEYKDAVDSTGMHFAVCCAWPLDKFMRDNKLTFPEAYELMTSGYELAAAKRGLVRQKSEGRLILIEYPIHPAERNDP